MTFYVVLRKLEYDDWLMTHYDAILLKPAAKSLKTAKALALKDWHRLIEKMRGRQGYLDKELHYVEDKDQSQFFLEGKAEESIYTYYIYEMRFAGRQNITS